MEKKLFEIPNRFTRKILYSGMFESLRFCVEAAVRTKSNLSLADLSGTNLRGTNLSGTNLSEADLRGTNLRGTNLSGANLSWTNLSEANLRGTNLSEANLSEADLSGADLDFSCLPLWCGSLKIKADMRIMAQLLYHVESIAEHSGIDIKTVDPNSFHRVVAGELPKIRKGGVE
jgi:hypothetical protein